MRAYQRYSCMTSCWVSLTFECHGVDIETVRGSVRVPWGKSYTPAILLVDCLGLIVDSFIGQLNATEESLLLTTLRSRQNLRPEAR